MRDVTGGDDGWHQGSGNSGSSNAGSSGSASGMHGLFSRPRTPSCSFERNVSRQGVHVFQLTKYSREGRVTATRIWARYEGCFMSAFAGSNNGWGGHGNGGSSSSSSSAAAGVHAIDCISPFPWPSFPGHMPVNIAKAVTCSDVEYAPFNVFICSIHQSCSSAG